MENSTIRMNNNENGNINPKVGIIVPCYNEEEIIDYTNSQLREKLSELKLNNEISKDSFIGYVDDGSVDSTWKSLEKFANENSDVKTIKLSKNFGHQAALLSGLLRFNELADCLISLDADLQDDIDVISEMISDYKNGNDIVYGVRKERKKDTFFKKHTALLFYKIMNYLGVNIIYNHADYRLTSKRVNTYLGSYKEVNLFLRGIFPLIGFNSSKVYYDRLERKAGESKYPFKKMLNFAFEGISSFSVKPLRIISIIGFIVFFISIFLALYSVYSFFYLGTVPGWTSITLPIYFISGIQLLSIGVIGEYLGKIYKEIKSRPRYIIDKELL